MAKAPAAAPDFAADEARGRNLDLTLRARLREVHRRSWHAALPRGTTRVQAR